VGNARERVRRRPEATVLYRLVQEHLQTFCARAVAAADGGGGHRALPGFVLRELRAFLACGVLAHGFCRVHCDACGLDELVAFSCKRRGFCPSCGGRRMADTAAFLVDEVLPDVPFRQWVLSLPHRLRLVCAYDPATARAVSGVLVRAVSSFYLRQARAAADAADEGDNGDPDLLHVLQAAAVQGRTALGGLSGLRPGERDARQGQSSSLQVQFPHGKKSLAPISTASACTRRRAWRQGVVIDSST
jgi:hypothetical protein